MLKNYKELNVWQKSYKPCLNIYRITENFPNEERYGLTSQKRHRRKRQNVVSTDNIVIKQTLESLIPGILGPSSPTKLEKIHFN